MAHTEDDEAALEQSYTELGKAFYEAFDEVGGWTSGDITVNAEYCGRLHIAINVVQEFLYWKRLDKRHPIAGMAEAEAVR